YKFTKPNCHDPERATQLERTDVCANNVYRGGRETTSGVMLRVCAASSRRLRWISLGQASSGEAVEGVKFYLDAAHTRSMTEEGEKEIAGYARAGP
ncbi:MAG TPA: hypothetical protein VF835_02175, partial [Rhizomicrobium sp.]